MHLRAILRSAVTAPLRSPIAAMLSAPHGVDAYLRALDPRLAVHEVRATIESIVRETPTSATLTLNPNLAWDGHRAGQHVRVGVEIQGVRHTRCFSISSSAHRRDGRITLTIRAVGKVSRHLVFDAKPGDELALSQAQGEFVLPEARPERILLISGGSGITPVMSMLRTLRDEKYQGEIVFVHYARSREEQIYRDEIDALDVKKLVVLGDHFSPAHLDLDVTQYEAFLCGPEPMMALVRKAVPAERLHEERFGGELVASSNDSGGDVHFAASKLRKPCDGRALLVLAEEAGLKPEHGCRRGICHGCTRRKVRGTVRDLRTGTLSHDGEEEIQICVTAPVGDVTLDL
ncbi:MAG: ferredoxin reductase [Polyangiales bacterium]